MSPISPKLAFISILDFRYVEICLAAERSTTSLRTMTISIAQKTFILFLNLFMTRVKELRHCYQYFIWSLV